MYYTLLSSANTFKKGKRELNSQIHDISTFLLVQNYELFQIYGGREMREGNIGTFSGES